MGLDIDDVLFHCFIVQRSSHHHCTYTYTFMTGLTFWMLHNDTSRIHSTTNTHTILMGTFQVNLIQPVNLFASLCSKLMMFRCPSSHQPMFYIHQWAHLRQLSNFSKYYICLLMLVGAPSATALHRGSPFLPSLKTVRPYIVLSATQSLTS